MLISSRRNVNEVSRKPARVHHVPCSTARWHFWYKCGRCFSWAWSLPLRRPAVMGPVLSTPSCCTGSVLVCVQWSSSEAGNSCVTFCPAQSQNTNAHLAKKCRSSIGDSLTVSQLPLCLTGRPGEQLWWPLHDGIGGPPHSSPKGDVWYLMPLCGPQR